MLSIYKIDNLLTCFIYTNGHMPVPFQKKNKINKKQVEVVHAGKMRVNK